jgi:hypothetical protein
MMVHAWWHGKSKGTGKRKGKRKPEDKGNSKCPKGIRTMGG